MHDDVPARIDAYAETVLAAIRFLRNKFSGLSFHNRVALIVPDAALMHALDKSVSDVDGKRFAFRNATDSNRIVSSSSDASEQTLVLDTIDNFDGLERLIVIAVGLDEVIGEGASRTRSRLYRAITRAQMMVVVVNEVLEGGWLEFLTRVEFDKDGEFDSEKEMEKSVRGAAQQILEKERQEAEERAEREMEKKARKEAEEKAKRRAQN